MFTCAQCAIEACRSGKLDQMPKNCPMHDPAFFEQVLEEYFKPENHDFFVASAAVEAMPQQFRVRPGAYEVMCNPIAQAELLNREGTQFNVCLGLCVGHDSLFYKYSKALVTTLVAKDRVTGNNPVAAIYCADGYLKKRLELED